MNNNDKGKKKQTFFKNPFFMFLIISLLLTVGLNFLMSSLTSPREKEVKYSEFIDMLERDEIHSVTITSEKISFKTKESVKATEEFEESVKNVTNFSDIINISNQSAEFLKKDIVYYTGYINDGDLIKLLEAHNVEYTRPVNESNIIVDIFLSFVLPMGLTYLFLMLIMRHASKKMGGGGFMSVGQSNAKIYLENKTGVTFSDVAGQEEAKESLDEIVDFLHNPAKYTAIGAKQPKGA